MRLIITRPRDNAAILKEKLKELGNYSIESILISIEPRAKAAIPSEAYQALALTSANAMLSPALAPAPAALREVPVFAVGAQSAAAARRAGYTTVVGEGGDVAGLGEAVTRHCDPKNGPVLYPSGSETAGDLKATLEGRGFRVDRVILYDAVPAEALAPEAIAAIKQGTADGVLLYSPRTARIWAKLLMQAGILAEGSRLNHFCLSQNVAAALGSGFTTSIAATPDEPSLLALLDRGA